MLRLLLLRHAKSSWDDSSLIDFDRPLSPRGIKAAPKMGRYMVDKGYLPDRILISTSQRTRETFTHILPYFRHNFDVAFERHLYETNARHNLDVVRKEGGKKRTVMLIGHNAALEDFALMMIKKGKNKTLERMRDKFPTAALAVIDFENISHWSEVEPKAGILVDFKAPKDL